MRRSSIVGLALVLLLVLAGLPARAQLGAVMGGHHEPVSRNAPVTFTADQVEYDREHALVIARGHVEAWQNEHVLRADKIVFNRDTGTAAATGHVVLLEPDGEVLFADYAEVTQNMHDAVLKDMRARLAENGKLAANGARRFEGALNELSRVVYSPCNLCKNNPSAPPFWQVRAASAVQDLQHKRIEYRDAELQMFGIPVAWTPYMSMPDPSVKRSSGLLMPSIGSTSQLGAYVTAPYFWAIDDQSDATITPVLTSKEGPQLQAEYRRRFNDGFIDLNGTGGYFNHGPQGVIDATGQFSLNDTWRWGFDVNRASSAAYVNAIRVGDAYRAQPNVLSSQIYAEGFGLGAYSRLDTRFYQGISSTIAAARLPVVLPRYEYQYFGQPDAWGGRLSVNTDMFNVLRGDGTDTRRGRLSVNWERPFTGALGDLWKLQLHGDAIAYEADDFNRQPNFGTHPQVGTARGFAQAALDFRWPFMRDSGDWGVQVIEPILQLVVAPTIGDSQWNRYPNEDSLDYEFTDANLFSLNRFPGVDRLEGGSRLSAALHGTWYLGGTTFDAFVGQSYQASKDTSFPAYSGLRDQVSDIVGHVSFAPTAWLDLNYRTRLDHRTLATRMADASLSFGVPKLRVTTGYLYTTYDPYLLYDVAPTAPNFPSAGSLFFQHRNEATLSASSRWGSYRASAYMRQDLTHHHTVAFGADASYENECFIFDMILYRRYTSINGDHGSTALILQFTFKTIGQFGYRAL